MMHAAFWFATLATISQACHQTANRHTHPTEGEGVGIEGIEKFFPNCIRAKTEENESFNSIVKFVVEHTAWYEYANNVKCRKSEHLDTVKCWEEAIVDLITDDSQIFFAVKKCLSEFDIYVQAEKEYIDSEMAYVPGRKPNKNKESCPPRTRTNFYKCVKDGLKGQFDTNLIDDIASIAIVTEKYLKCSQCDCNGVLEVNNDFAISFVKKDLTCDSCWSTRMAGLVKKDSYLVEAFRSCATA